MAAVLVLAGSVIVATEPVGAQSNTTLVSNLQKASPFSGDVGPGFNDDEGAASFTTGAHDYGLVSATLQLRTLTSFGQNPVPEVAIHSDSSGRPGERLFTLDNPSNIGSITGTRADFTFSAPPSASLASNTTYWLNIYATGDPMAVAVTSVAGKDSGSQDDWSIAHSFILRERNSGPAWQSVSGQVFKYSLRGTVTYSPTRTESPDADLPFSDETWGFVDTGCLVDRQNGRYP